MRKRIQWPVWNGLQAPEEAQGAGWVGSRGRWRGRGWWEMYAEAGTGDGGIELKARGCPA